MGDEFQWLLKEEPWAYLWYLVQKYTHLNSDFHDDLRIVISVKIWPLFAHVPSLLVCILSMHAKNKNQLKLLSMWYYLVFASSFSDADDNKEEFYNADPKTPVFEWSTKCGQYNIEQLSRILVFEDVEPQKVCSGTPSNISHNVTFVVNLEEVGGLGDLKADEMGVWNRQGVPKAYISIRHKEGSKKEVIRRQKTMDLPHHYTITRTYYRNGSSPDLQKLIVTVEGE